MITKIVDFMQEVASAYAFRYEGYRNGRRVNRKASVVFCLAILALLGFLIWTIASK
jgi:hypothetical protein